MSLHQPDRKLKLGVNIDHVATLRQARYSTLPDLPTAEPNLLAAAHEAEANGADSITVHLRQDRRHIPDRRINNIYVEDPNLEDPNLQIDQDFLRGDPINFNPERQKNIFGRKPDVMLAGIDIA